MGRRPAPGCHRLRNRQERQAHSWRAPGTPAFIEPQGEQAGHRSGVTMQRGTSQASKDLLGQAGAVMPAVALPWPGGLTTEYNQVAPLVTKRRGREHDLRCIIADSPEGGLSSAQGGIGGQQRGTKCLDAS